MNGPANTRSSGSSGTPDRLTRRAPGRPAADGDGIASETILKLALHAFATYGYEGVSVRTLNRQLGGSHSLVNQRFGSKAALWRAAADFGFGRITRDLAEVFDPTVTDPLEQLHRWIRRFLVLSADHPELVGLVNLEGREDSPRLAYIYDTYVATAMSRVGLLLEHLAEIGRIRPIPLRTFYFLVIHGGAASHTLVALAEHFDPASPLATGEVADNAALVADLIITGLRLPPDGRYS
ncbi:TetR/AcrR family transcriptional regulator [Streptomyces sp. NPDC056192]|uniref:TetR/AcrR family transcriptional regulator n=1 Tax=Streptomyces sp. NPDC056192 TaxID=3345743 RepID=UPI0035E010FF